MDSCCGLTNPGIDSVGRGEESRHAWASAGHSGFLRGLGFHYERYPNVTVGVNENAILCPQHLSELAEDTPC